MFEHWKETYGTDLASNLSVKVPTIGVYNDLRPIYIKYGKNNVFNKCIRCDNFSLIFKRFKEVVSTSCVCAWSAVTCKIQYTFIEDNGQNRFMDSPHALVSKFLCNNINPQDQKLWTIFQTLNVLKIDAQTIFVE